MSEPLVTVATFPNPVEAQIARNALADEGIAAYLADAETVGMLWHVGTALGGVKVQVAEADLERARRVLEAPAERADRAVSDYDLEDEPRPRARGRAPAGADDEDEAPESARDVTAGRAWRSAVIGLLLCPPLLHIYSAWLLLQIPWEKGPLSAAGRRRLLGALALDGLVFGAVVLVVPALARW